MDVSTLKKFINENETVEYLLMCVVHCNYRQETLFKCNFDAAIIRKFKCSIH